MIIFDLGGGRCLMMSIVATTPVLDLPLWGLLAVSAAIGAVVAGGGALVFSRFTRLHHGGSPDEDHVTGAASRRAFIAQLNTQWQDWQAGGGEFGLLVIDIDAFGDINQIYGRATGDRVLAEVAERLQLRIRANDLVARVDADEFAVICRGISAQHLETIRGNLEAYVNFSESVPVTLSIGIAAPREDDDSALQLLDRARGSLAERRLARPETVFDDALAALLLPR